MRRDQTTKNDSLFKNFVMTSKRSSPMEFENNSGRKLDFEDAGCVYDALKSQKRALIRHPKSVIKNFSQSALNSLNC